MEPLGSRSPRKTSTGPNWRLLSWILGWTDSWVYCVRWWIIAIHHERRMDLFLFSLIIYLTWEDASGTWDQSRWGQSHDWCNSTTWRNMDMGSQVFSWRKFRSPWKQLQLSTSLHESLKFSAAIISTSWTLKQAASGFIRACHLTPTKWTTFEW